MTGIIILAAGASSRLGRAKQQLTYKGKTLLKHIIDEAILSECFPVLVILGANEQTIRNEINSPTIQIVINNNWETGMSSSIKSGLKALMSDYPNISQTIITVCDQPYLDHKLLRKLILEKKDKGSKIVACSYNDTQGTPVLFDKSLFPLLLELKGNEGAKKIIYSNLADVVSILFPLGSVDIDTTDDYENLLKTNT